MVVNSIRVVVQKILMVSFFHLDAILDYYNFVGVFDCAKSMGNHYDSQITNFLLVPVNSILHFPLVGVVKSRGSFIKK